MSDKPLQKRPQRPTQLGPANRPLKRKKARPDSQSTSFISDQSMWEMVMDIEEGELDMQPTAKHSGKPDASSKALISDSRAETIPIKKRRKTTQSGQKPQREVQALINQASGNKASKKSTTSAQKPIIEQTKTIAPNQNSIGQRKITTTSSSNITPQARDRDLGTQSQVSVIRRSTKQANSYPEFTTREIDNNIQPQDLTDVYKKLEQERFLKYLKIPVLFFVKRWTLIVTAILFFGLGYYIGSTGNDVTENARKPSTWSETKTNPSHPVANKRQPVNKPKPRTNKQPKVAPMVPKPQIEEPITIQPAEDIETFGLIDSQQFDGIDITISEQNVEPVSEVSDDIEIGDPPSAPIENKPPTTKLQKLSDENIHAFNNRKWEIVIKTSNEILSLQSNTINALINRSVAYTELGLYDLAINDCILAIAIEPKNPLAYNNRGYAYEKMGRINSAIADYNKACELGIELSCKEVSRLNEFIASTE